MDALGACGRKTSELGQGQAAVFCSLAKPLLTQRRGARLRCGSMLYNSLYSEYT